MRQANFGRDYHDGPCGYGLHARCQLPWLCWAGFRFLMLAPRHRRARPHSRRPLALFACPLCYQITRPETRPVFGHPGGIDAVIPFAAATTVRIGLPVVGSAWVVSILRFDPHRSIARSPALPRRTLPRTNAYRCYRNSFADNTLATDTQAVADSQRAGSQRQAAWGGRVGLAGGAVYTTVHGGHSRTTP